MWAKINDVFYRLKEGWKIKESAGTTSLMNISVNCKDKPVPQPFDILQIGENSVIIGEDLLESGIKENVNVTDDIRLARININFDYTWRSLAGKSWNQILL